MMGVALAVVFTARLCARHRDARFFSAVFFRKKTKLCCRGGAAVGVLPGGVAVGVLPWGVVDGFRELALPYFLLSKFCSSGDDESDLFLGEFSPFFLKPFFCRTLLDWYPAWVQHRLRLQTAPGLLSQETSPVTSGATLGCCLNYNNHPVKDDCPRRLVRGLLILKGQLPLFTECNKHRLELTTL